MNGEKMNKLILGMLALGSTSALADSGCKGCMDKKLT
jgi:hypothetical protein